MDVMTVALLAVGFALLVFGAELLARPRRNWRSASRPGWPAMPTSPSPTRSGSNIFNVLFILGACAAMKPLLVHRQLVRLEVPIMIAASAMLMALSWDGKLGFWDGWVLFSGITVFTVWAIRRSRREEAVAVASGAPRSRVSDQPQKTAGRIYTPISWVLAGVALLVLGARWMVDGAILLAEAMGVGQVVIGLTIVAAGTSLPEVFTSLMATIRGERTSPSGTSSAATFTTS